MTPPCFCLTARRFSARWRWARRILRGKNRRNRRLGHNHEKCPGFDHSHHCNGGSRLGSCAQTAVADDIERARRKQGKKRASGSKTGEKQSARESSSRCRKVLWFRLRRLSGFRAYRAKPPARARMKANRSVLNSIMRNERPSFRLLRTLPV